MKQIIICLIFSLVSAVALQAETQEHQGLKTANSHIVQVLQQFDARAVNLQVSAVKSYEWGDFIPIEVSFVFCGGASMLQIIDELEALQDDIVKLRAHSINISVTAEVRREDRKPLLSATMLLSASVGDNPDLSPGFARENFSTVFQNHDFSPGIERNSVIEEISVWITNMRQDMDGRMQLTGYGKSFSDVISFGAEISRNQTQPGFQLNSINKNVYYKQPVFRFDLTSNSSNIQLDENYFSLLSKIFDNLEELGCSFNSLRIAPIIMVNGFEIPMEISIDDIGDNSNETIASALCGIEIPGYKIRTGESSAEQNKLVIQLYVSNRDN